MIDAIIAGHQERGLVEVLSAVEDVRIVGQAQSPEQLLSRSKKVNPHVLVLSSNFLPVFPKIERMLKRRKTALQLLAEKNPRLTT
jgi:DNA-binding NarL/FixJ family response regulator